MPCGLVRSGDFRNGYPLTLPHTFGNPCGSPEPFGNNEPQANATLDSNPITWVPAPSHFGNQTGFSLQVDPKVSVITHGTSGTATITITDLGGFTGSVTLSYSGAPTGVTIAFVPNPATATSTATITVGAAVPSGKYTITVTGTSGTETETTDIHLTVL